MALTLYLALFQTSRKPCIPENLPAFPIVTKIPSSLCCYTFTILPLPFRKIFLFQTANPSFILIPLFPYGWVRTLQFWFSTAERWSCMAEDRFYLNSVSLFPVGWCLGTVYLTTFTFLLLLLFIFFSPILSIPHSQRWKSYCLKSRN